MGGLFSKNTGRVDRTHLTWLPDDIGFDEDGRPIERIAYANDLDKNRVFEYVSNFISTGKYTVWSFLPVNLFEQFQRLANAYFLLLLILMCIPQVTSLNPISTALPLVFVLGLTALKDGYDDYKRHKSDRELNGREVEVFRGQWETVDWDQVLVGDIIRIEKDDPVAADVVLLDSDLPHGHAFMETAELDGETNLKLRQALLQTANKLSNDEALKAFHGYVICEPPNQSLHTFTGKMVVGTETCPLDAENVLLRGMTMRNTQWAIGLVVFAGHDTKLMMNAGGARFKRTQIDELTNVLIIYIFYILCAFCLISGIGAGIWQGQTGQGFQIYLPADSTYEEKPVVVGILSFFSFIILYNTLVPISLYVSVEFIRLGQSWMIDWDLNMYHPETDTPAHVRTTTLNEELGQIEYIFSDKTGTLTQNVMRFLKCSIHGKQYGKGFTEAAKAAMARKGLRARDSMYMPVDFSSNPYHDPDFVFYDQELFDEAKEEEPHVDAFMRLLALCHTVQAEVTEDGRLKYNAQSPDEAALVSAAKNFGYVFKTRNLETLTIEVNGKEETYRFLHVLEFNSDRKRMSIILRCPDGKVRLYCKGADNMIMARVIKDDALENTTNKHLEEYASDGLRTLCLAMRDIDEATYMEWSKKFAAAQLSMDDRQTKIDAVSEEIEKNMTLLGSTAIEDRLQAGVPECIANLRKADIKIWVLTGDKQETAINIGFSCQLLSNDMQIFIVNERSKTEVLNTLQALKDQADDKVNPVQKALVIDGPSLEFALEEECRLELLDLATACRAVICCRVSPSQKAEVVKLVKDNKKAATLAIGDGANDVSMIQAAHIGVGISGLEGRQAVLASDYSFAQFRFLERLLLVHGRWSYIRMTKFLKYFFYKNFAFTLQQFWYNIYAGWSAQSVFNSWVVTFYNVIYTSLPVLALGILEQDVNDQWSLMYPGLYVAGQKGLYFDKIKFLVSLLHGFWHSAVIFYFAYWAFGDTAINAQGWTGGLEWFSIALTSSTIIIVNLVIALDTYRWTIFNHIFTWGSIISFWIFGYYMFSQPMFIWGFESYYGSMFYTQNNLMYWLYTLATVVACMGPLVLEKYLRCTFFPTPIEIVREKKYLDSQARKGNGRTTLGSVPASQQVSDQTNNIPMQELNGETVQGPPEDPK
eukprot:comp24187_c0_seq2/m.44324 comp24187_c0_seq2/g.44324  ORF comp24187_c0_seq2/g.44324 comp24187_c0_seq2/m.44324 type:complete len:1154 (-) comp24187_c0_seq2:702-4163(-)